MHTEELWITYRCEFCTERVLYVRRYISPTPIDNLSIAMNDPQHPELKAGSRCTSCGNIMCMVHLDCKIIPSADKYGADYDGHWECELGHIEKVYPIPLKRMDKRDGFARYRNDERYKLIAEAGYPWRCPVCKQCLIYKQDKRY